MSQQFENITISKGPDAWRLAEAMFHDEEATFDGAVIVSFTGTTTDGKEWHLSVIVNTITKMRIEPGLFQIKEIARIHEGRRNESPIEHVPVEISFSTRSRKGFARASFEK
jgi:hypothetical protein